jgi:hypothetical protein
VNRIVPFIQMASTGPAGIHDSALQIIRLPLPQRQQSFDSTESVEMDFMTAISLNSENIQVSKQPILEKDKYPIFTGLSF